jgi:hypothetical protein
METEACTALFACVGPEPKTPRRPSAVAVKPVGARDSVHAQLTSQSASPVLQPRDERFLFLCGGEFGREVGGVAGCIGRVANLLSLFARRLPRLSQFLFDESQFLTLVALAALTGVLAKVGLLVVQVVAGHPVPSSRFGVRDVYPEQAWSTRHALWQTGSGGLPRPATPGPLASTAPTSSISRQPRRQQLREPPDPAFWQGRTGTRPAKKEGDMTQGRTVYRVQPGTDAGLWKLSKNGLEIADFGLQKRAIDRGREMARGDQPSQLFVHGMDRKIEDEATYQEDPFPPRG